MKDLIFLFVRLFASIFFSHAALHAENLALLHQICVLRRSTKRFQIRPADRIFWVALASHWSGWKDSLAIVKPATVIRWQRKRFRQHWARISRRKKQGRPAVPRQIRELIQTMSRMNITWGAPRIVGELAKLGIEVSKSTVERYMVRAPKPSNQTWRSFLANHASEIVSIDFLVVPTVRFKILYILVFLSIERRRIVYFNVTQHPSAVWTGQQVVEAFPWDSAPKFLLRDRDGVYGDKFQDSERLNGSIRRECLDQVIVFSERHLKRILSSYVDYYKRSRTHL